MDICLPRFFQNWTKAIMQQPFGLESEREKHLCDLINPSVTRRIGPWSEPIMGKFSTYALLNKFNHSGFAITLSSLSKIALSLDLQFHQV